MRRLQWQVKWGSRISQASSGESNGKLAVGKSNGKLAVDKFNANIAKVHCKVRTDKSNETIALTTQQETRTLAKTKR